MPYNYGAVKRSSLSFSLSFSAFFTPKRGIFNWAICIMKWAPFLRVISTSRFGAQHDSAEILIDIQLVQVKQKWGQKKMTGKKWAENKPKHSSYSRMIKARIRKCMFYNRAWRFPCSDGGRMEQRAAIDRRRVIPIFREVMLLNCGQDLSFKVEILISSTLDGYESQISHVCFFFYFWLF